VSGLAGLLAGHHHPGVYQWHAAFGPSDVRHTVEHAGARFAYVDGWTHQDKTELLDALAKALSFPDWFGHNFDALADCLRDIDGDPLVLLWDGWGTLARADRRAFDVTVDIFAGRVAEGPSPFTVLLRGEGPDIDVRSLDG
jgi:RNAse (barnase) inhibitor barstar